MCSNDSSKFASPNAEDPIDVVTPVHGRWEIYYAQLQEFQLLRQKHTALTHQSATRNASIRRIENELEHIENDLNHQLERVKYYEREVDELEASLTKSKAKLSEEQHRLQSVHASKADKQEKVKQLATGVGDERQVRLQLMTKHSEVAQLGRQLQDSMNLVGKSPFPDLGLFPETGMEQTDCILMSGLPASDLTSVDGTKSERKSDFDFPESEEEDDNDIESETIHDPGAADDSDYIEHQPIKSSGRHPKVTRRPSPVGTESVSAAKSAGTDVRGAKAAALALVFVARGTMSIVRTIEGSAKDSIVGGYLKWM